MAQSTFLLGSQSVALSQDSVSNGTSESFPVTATSTGSLASLALYVDSSSNSRKVIVGIYSDSANRPALLLTQGTLSTIQSGAWNTIPLPSIGITSGTRYWIALLSTRGTLYFRDAATGGCSSITSAQQNLTALPANWSSGSSWNTCQLSAYGVSAGVVPPSVLSVAPQSFTFNAIQGGANPSPASISITNTGGGSLAYTAVSDSPWLSVAPATGNAPQTASVSTSIASLVAGSYTGHITITALGAQNSPATASVSLNVSPATLPAPVLNSILPATVVAGNPAFSLALGGSNFVTGDVVLWNGAALGTNFISPTQLTASISSSLVASSGTATLVVQAPGGAVSNSLTFSITAPAQPPSITSISPNTAVAGSPALSITITGNNFVSGDAVLWNSSAVATTFVSPTQLSALVPSSMLAISGNASITVQAPGGAVSNSSNFSITAPVAVLASISPTTAISGGPAFTLTANGSAFVSGSAILWNGSPLPTTFLSSTQLTTSVPSTLITTPATISIAIQAPGGSTTNSVSFVITLPVPPALSSLSPVSALAGGPAFTLTVTGSNFVSGDIVQWNGSSLTTSFVSSTQLTATVPSSAIAVAGSSPVTVLAPDGNSSNSLSFPVTSGAPQLLLGAQTLFTGPDSDAAGDSEAFQSTASASGTLDTLAVYVDSSTTATSLSLGLYADSAGRPGALLTGASTTTVTSSAWNVLSVPPVAVTAGTRYWIALLSTGGTLRFRNGSGCTSVNNSQRNLSALPATWSSGSTWPTCPISAYGSSSSGSGGGSGGSTASISGSITPTAGGSGATLALSGFSVASTTADASGAYSFTSLATGTYVITPSNTGYSFTPPSQTVTLSGSNRSGVNFTAVPATLTFSLSGSVSPATAGAGTILTLSGNSSATTSADSNGNFSFSGLSNGTYTVSASSQTALVTPSAQTVTINSSNVTGVNFTATTTSNVIFFDDFLGSSLSSDWTVISRHGEYAQNETECNIPQEVSVANGLLTITTAVGPAICGDFNLDGSVRHAPQSWPYITGDVQWKSLNFTYGTVSVRAKFPSENTSLWPAIWLLGSNCQRTNPLTADVAYDTCPDLNSSNYTEIDITECYQSSWCQLALANYANKGSGGSSWPTCVYPVDTNFHVYSLNWTANAVSVSVDGQPTGCSYKSPEWTIPSTPMFLLIQTQTGGVGKVPQNSTLPATLEVDFVKVTQP